MGEVVKENTEKNRGTIQKQNPILGSFLFYIWQKLEMIDSQRLQPVIDKHPSVSFDFKF